MRLRLRVRTLMIGVGVAARLVVAAIHVLAASRGEVFLRAMVGPIGFAAGLATVKAIASVRRGDDCSARLQRGDVPGRRPLPPSQADGTA